MINEVTFFKKLINLAILDCFTDFTQKITSFQPMAVIFSYCFLKKKKHTLYLPVNMMLASRTHFFVFWFQ